MIETPRGPLNRRKKSRLDAYCARFMRRNNRECNCRIDDDPTKYNDLTCEEDMGWTTSGNETLIRKDNDKFNVECIEKRKHLEVLGTKFSCTRKLILFVI